MHDLANNVRAQTQEEMLKPADATFVQILVVLGCFVEADCGQRGRAPCIWRQPAQMLLFHTVKL